jgi:hypothetical protein
MFSLGISVPTARMRNGDFSELLNTTLTGSSQPIRLFQPNSGGSAPLAYNGQSNVFAPNEINAVAQNILKMYPAPNTGTTLTNNYTANLKNLDNTFQWDTAWTGISAP